MYVIAGASGHTGLVAAQTLLSQGKPVRGLARHPEKATALRDQGAELVSVDLEDTAALTRALTGASGAYFLLPPRPTSNQVVADQARVTESIGQAVAKSGVPHVVFLSSIGGQLEKDTGPIVTLHRTEERLRETGAAVTILRPGYFMENWLPSLAAVPGGVLPSFLREGLVMPMIATRDIGLVAARVLAEGGKGFQVIELAGPRDYTTADVAAAVSSIVGRPIQPQYGPEEAIVPAFMSFGMSEDMASLYREMIHGFNHGKIQKEGGAARQLRGTVPIEEVLRPALSVAKG